MKKITLWLFALLSCWQISAQVGGYSFTEGAGAYAALGGTNITATGDDGTQNTLPIGFSFNFGGTPYTTFSVTTNGWIRLGANIPGSAWTNDAANFTNAGFMPLIAPIWDDNHRNTGAITYSVSGATPNQVLTVDYNNVNIGGGGSTSATSFANYQIKLYETTNVIEFHYGSMATAGALTATIGLSDTSGFQSVTPGTPGTSSNVTANHAVSAVTNIANKMYRFTPPACAAPGGLNATSITATTATINWNAVVPAPTGYEYVVSTTNTAPAGSGTATTNISEPLTSLLPQTTYYVFVRTNCGGTFSPWNSFSFITACAPITTYPSLEPFATFLPNQCWMKGDGGDLTAGPATFGNNNFYVDGFANVGTTGSFAYNIWLAAANDWIISPEFTIPATGYELKFDAAAVNYGATTPVTNWESDDTVEILVSSTGTTNWTPLYTYNDSNVPSNTGTTNALDLDAYSTQTVRFAIRVVEGASDGAADLEFSIDNFQVRMSPTCPDQTGLAVGNITSSGADTSWDDMSAGGSVGYQYAVTTSATPPASGTATTATFYIATGLAAQTVYYLHVRSECSGSTYGNWTSIPFTTACSSITDFNENFDAVTTPALPQCWSKILSGGTISTFASVNTGTTNASAPNGVDLYNSNSGATDNIMLVTPMLSNLGAGTHRLKFKARNTTATQDLEIGVLTDPSDAGTFTLVEAVDITTAFQDYVVNFDTYTGPGVVIALRRLSTSTYTNVYLDNIVWEAMPSCPDQTGLAVGNITSSGADTSWDDLSGSGVSGYEYAVSTSATPPASGTATTATFYVATGLPAQTLHYLHVRTNCGAGSYGIWVSIPFTTQCASITSLPWIENFDAVTTPAIPQCWSEQNGDYGTAVAGTYNTAHSGANYLRDAWSATNEFMWTPAFDLVAGTSYDFSSWIQGDGATSWTVDFFVNNAQNSTGATQLGPQYVVPGSGPIAIQPYAQVTRSFVPATSGTYYFAFRVNEATGGPWYVAFDDVELKLSPSTPPACTTNLVATPDACGNFANNLTWDLEPTATGYYITIGTTSGGTDIANAVNLGSNSYSFTGTIGTTYFWKVVPYNAAGPATGCVEQSFATAATGCYCTSVPTSNDGSGITTAVVGATSNPIADVTYTNLTAVPVIVEPGTTANVQLTFSTGYTYDINIWIDFNNDYDFNDAGELVKTGIACTAATPNTVDASFTMPLTATSGLHRMRIGSADDGQVPPDPCYSDSYGVTLDFAVDTTLGSASFDTTNFVAYPNPVNDVLNLSYKTAISNVSVHNLLGQEVLNTKTNSNEVQVNMSALTAGAYIVNITVEDTVHTIKVIKK